MKFNSITVAVVTKENKVKRVIPQPNLPSKDGLPVFPVGVRRLLNVPELMKKLGLSRNKASEYRRKSPELCLA